MKKALDLYQCTSAAVDGTPTTARPVKIPNPPVFNKGRIEYRTFKDKLQEKLQADAASFPTAEHQVTFSMVFWPKRPSTWCHLFARTEKSSRSKTSSKSDA